MKMALIGYTAVVLMMPMNRIATINRLKSEAEAAYHAGNYATAIQQYTYLVDSLQVNEEAVLLNLANAYFQAGDTAHAATYYRNLQHTLAPDIRSRSNQQLGVIANRKSRFEQALNHFKQALKADPSNEDARFNYELLMKKLKDKSQQQKDGDKNKQDKNQQQKDGDKNKQDKNQQQKDGDKNKRDKNQQQKDGDKNKQDKNQQQKDGDKNKQDKNQQQKDGDKNKRDKNQQQKDGDKNKQDKNEQQKDGDKGQQDKNQQQGQQTPSSISDKLKKMNISEEKAKMILEAMKNSEIQYLQQKKRKASKPKGASKEDW